MPSALTQELLQPKSRAIPNNIIEAIRSGAALDAIKLAAARGLLPLSNEELLESVVTLGADPSDTVRQAATATLDRRDPDAFINLASQ